MKLEVFVSHLTVEAKFADLLRSSLTRDFVGLVNFYTTLRRKPLAEACEFAGLTSQAPMRLLTQQMPAVMKMTFSDGPQ